MNGWLFILLIIGFFWFNRKSIDTLGCGLFGYHESRGTWFNLDIMIYSWITVGLLFAFIEWLL